MNTIIKRFMLLSSFFSSISVVAECSLENNSVLEALNQPKEPEPETQKENKIDLKWLNEKEELLQRNITTAIEQGNYSELKKTQKSRIDSKFKPTENIELDELIEAMACAVKLQKGPKKLILFKEFTDYCKQNAVSTDNYFDEKDMNLIKRLSLNQFNKNSLILFKLAFGIDKTVSDSLKDKFYNEKKHYCDSKFNQAFKKECNLCHEYEKVIKENSTK